MEARDSLIGKGHPRHRGDEGGAEVSGPQALYLLDEVGQGLLATRGGGVPAEDHVGPAELGDVHVGGRSRDLHVACGRNEPCEAG